MQNYKGTKYGVVLLVMGLFYNLGAQAQRVSVKAEEIKELQERILLVELLELPADHIDKWRSKAEKSSKPKVVDHNTKLIDEHTAFVNKYNANIKLAVEAEWDLNQEVEYRSSSEIDKLSKQKNSKYAFLRYGEATENGGVRAYDAAISIANKVPVLVYSRVEKGLSGASDYSLCIPYFGFVEEDRAAAARYHYAPNLLNLSLTMKLMKGHIAEIEKSDKKKHEFKARAVKQAKINCEDLATKKIGLSKGIVHRKTTISEIASTYSAGELVEYTIEDITKAMENKEEVIIGCAIAWQIVGRVLYLKAFINLQNGTIYTCTGTVMGEMNDSVYRAAEFRGYGKCD